MKIRPTIALASLFALGAFGAAAADLQPAPPSMAVSGGWIVTLTGNVQAGPRFPGSDRFGVFGYPSIDFRRVGEPAHFSAPDDGFGFAVLDTPTFRIGPVARYRAGRYYGDDRQALFGLRKVQWSIEPGLFVEYWPLEMLRLRAELRYGVHGYEGFVGDVAADWVQRYGRFTFSLGPRLALGDTSFTDAYFSVTPLEAALNGRVAPFRATGGVTSVGALASVSYAWSEQWSSTVYARYDRLVGDAGDSPITRRLGSADQFTVGASLSYSFVFAP